MRSAARCRGRASRSMRYVAVNPFAHIRVLLGQVVGEWHDRIGQKAQHVLLAGGECQASCRPAFPTRLHRDRRLRELSCSGNSRISLVFTSFSARGLIKDARIHPGGLLPSHETVGPNGVRPLRSWSCKFPKRMAYVSRIPGARSGQKPGGGKPQAYATSTGNARHGAMGESLPGNVTA